ncbi:MAG: hypothetical protein HZA15_08640 [Nitrospirae bacterium]|nr:hypothetical protein [Nitrospirota bacterium]
MEKIRLRKDFVDERSVLTQCPVCDTYVHQEESFTCPRCNKSPLCRKHRVPGRKECASCVFDLTRKELDALRRQEESLQQFLRFLQFIFLCCAVIFIALKFGMSEFVEILQHSQLPTYIMYFSIIPVAGYILFFLILYNQRGKVADMEHQIRKLEVRR